MVDSFQLAAFHGLMFSKEEAIYGSSDETIDHEERNACAIQRFAGILAKQLLMMGQRLKREEQRKRKREEWRRMVASSSSTNSDEFISSQESNTVSGFEGMDEEDEEEEVVGGGGEGVVTTAAEQERGNEMEDWNKVAEVVLVSFRDRMGNLHEAKKYPWRWQATNNRKYTPSRPCCIGGCDARSRVFCKQCKLPFCYKLAGHHNWEGSDDGDDGESCFAKHVKDIKRKSGRN